MNRLKSLPIRWLTVVVIGCVTGLVFLALKNDPPAPTIPPRVAEPMVELCRLGGVDAITREHVIRLLQSHSFRWGSEGSIMNASIFVEKSKLDQAVHLLEKSAQAETASISISRQSDNALWVRSHYFESFEQTFGQHIDELHKSDHGFYSQILEAIGSNERSYLHEKKLPIVKRISGSKCLYLGADESLMTGYFVEIKLANKLENPSANYTESYQVWNQFQEVQFLGGLGGGELPD